MKVLLAIPCLDHCSDADTMSEDTYCCNIARKAGYLPYCDPILTREIGHIGTRVFRPGV